MPSPFTSSFASAAAGNTSNEGNTNGRNSGRGEGSGDWWVQILGMMQPYRVYQLDSTVLSADKHWIIGRELAAMAPLKHSGGLLSQIVYRTKENPRRLATLHRVVVFMFRHIWTQTINLPTAVMEQLLRIGIPETSYLNYSEHRGNLDSPTPLSVIFSLMDGVRELWMVQQMVGGERRKITKKGSVGPIYAGIMKEKFNLLDWLIWPITKKR